ncbi:MAG: hypothetical protein L3K10_05450 [Thermoplasmata archaeon]|nr:hypothetical protein [Thermoplasmata archaeon]
MSRRALIVAVVVLLIASSMIVLGPAEVRGAPAAAPRAAPAHPSVSVIQMYTSNGENTFSNITYFTTGTWYGPGTNILYFSVYDPTADTSVTFTITDPNATRDGVTSPAYTATVAPNTTTHYYYSWQTGRAYTFPATLKIGGGWNVSVTGTLGGTATYPIYVGTYFTNIAGSPQPGAILLPGETVTVAYQAVSDANGAPWTSVTNVALDGWYTGANATTKNLFTSGIVLQPTAAPLGSYTFTVPADATVNTAIFVVVWDPIMVAGHEAENESFEVSYTVGSVYIYSFHMESDSGAICPGGYSSEYASGAFVQACAVVGATAFDAFTPVPNLTVAINFWNGSAVVTPPGNTPATLMSNASGDIAFSFWANSPQFSNWYTYPFYNTVNLTVTDPAAKPVPANGNFEAWDNSTFWVLPSGASVGVTVTLNQLTFYPGQTITATWSLNPTNASTGTVMAVAWYLWGTNGWFLGQGPISSTANTGTLAVMLPSGYTGQFTLDVFASNSSTQFEGQVGGVVVAPSLTLNPGSTTFSPGSSIKVSAEAWADASVNAPTITYQVFAEYYQGWTGSGGGGLVASGTVANGSSFTINVPSTGAPSHYVVYAYLSSAASGTLASATLTLSQSWGYNVLVGVTTKSDYSDGSFQPGQTLTVSYQIAPYGNAPLPVFYTFELLVYSTQIGSLISTASSSGTFQFTIPSDWPSGVVFLELELQGTYLAGNSCNGGFCFGETAVTVNANPSFLSMEIGAGSGVTIGWLILLIIIIVVGLLLYVLIRRKKSTPPPSGGTTVTEPMSPAAPAPSGPGATEWNAPPSSGSDAPTSSGDSPPPMPSPPSGAT